MTGLKDRLVKVTLTQKGADIWNERVALKPVFEAGDIYTCTFSELASITHSDKFDGPIFSGFKLL